MQNERCGSLRMKGWGRPLVFQLIVIPRTQVPVRKPKKLEIRKRVDEAMSTCNLGSEAGPIA